MNLLQEKAKKLKFHGIVANWADYENEQWLEPLLLAEEEEQARRAVDSRVKEARVGQVKPMSEFDWKWPVRIDREQIEELFKLEFVAEKSNVVLVGTNGLGKTMIAKNLANAALMKNIRSRFIKASDMLNELTQNDGSRDRRACLRRYCNYPLLVIDEVGYLTYDNRFADLLYEIISGRYERHSTVVTTNKGFGQWQEIFPHAACAVTLVDRLTHKAETILIEGDSYRAKEAAEHKASKAKARSAGRKRSADRSQ